MANESACYPNILVIDDDAAFGRALAQAAASAGARVDWRRSLAELGAIGRLAEYDVVVADLAAEPVGGLEIADYAAALVPELPVLLTSDGSPPAGVVPLRRWPPSVHAHIPKRRGVAWILGQALAVCVASADELAVPPMPRAGAIRAMTA